MDKHPIIVTGSCGRIGTQVVKRLKENYPIIGFELPKSACAPKQKELIPVDLSSDESVQQAFVHIKQFYGTKISSVIHLAAYYSFSEKESPLYDLVTVKGTQRLLQALQGFEVEQFLFTSTMLVHAKTTPRRPINEDSPVVASWGYPRSKIETEELIHEMRGGIPVVNLRIAGVYDDQCHSIPISNQIQRIYEKRLEARMFPGDTSHGASFVHMDDLIDAIELCVEKRAQLPPELTLLIGEPKTLSYDAMQRKISHLLYNKEFATFRIPKIIAKIGAWIQCAISFQHKPFIRPWMIDFSDDHYELDISRAQKTLGWSPNRSVGETLPKMIDALKEDPEQFYKINGLHA
jgi:nucleoside-diphosphate-sugar epimerase